jgi:hypothetical protein
VWGGAGLISKSICGFYTEGERAVLNVIAAECNASGASELSLNQMADRAGVGRTSVHLAIQKPRSLHHIQVQLRQELGIANKIKFCAGAAGDIADET